jgi:hypothetical protein
MPSPAPLTPNFYGHIASTLDALLLFEACLNGTLNHVPRRPLDRERSSLIKSGNVFIYEENSSGIKRWTDGIPWSPSRILGNFLVYRQLERPFPPGEKKRAMKRSKMGTGIDQESYTDLRSRISISYDPASTSNDPSTLGAISKETERSLIGSLVDSYGFKDDGLVKKTVSVTIGGVSHHLVSYYTVADIMNNKFSTPSKDSRFQHISPRPDLISNQNFRTPIHEIDSMDQMNDSSVYKTLPYSRNNYEMTNQTLSSRESLPRPSISYSQPSNIFSSHTTTTTPGGYDGLSEDLPVSFGEQYVSPSTIYATPKVEGYDTGYRSQRYNSAVGIDISSGRPRVSPVRTDFSRRTSIFDQDGLVISNVSGLSYESNDSAFSNDSGYASQEFYGNPRDTSNIQCDYSAGRSLPNPTMQTTYERYPVVPAYLYTAAQTLGSRDSMWPIGNASAGHGHHISSQQWAGIGTS